MNPEIQIDTQAASEGVQSLSGIFGLVNETAADLAISPRNVSDAASPLSQFERAALRLMAYPLAMNRMIATGAAPLRRSLRSVRVGHSRMGAHHFAGSCGCCAIR